MPAFFARISNAGYEQFPDLMVVVPLEGFTPGSAPPRPSPQPPLGIWGPPQMPPGAGGEPPLGIWGPGDPRPTQPIYLPDPVPPTLPGLPPPGSPGTPSNPIPPGEVPPHASQGITKFYLLLPGVGVVGPFYAGPGVSAPVPPPATSKPA